jgi:hypothetical protein
MRLAQERASKLQGSSLTQLYRWRDIVELARGLGVEKDLSRYPWEYLDDESGSEDGESFCQSTFGESSLDDDLL